MIGNQYIENLCLSWHKWKELSVNRKIFSASLAIGLLTLIVGVFSLAKELFVAYKFGTSGELDAFLIAFLLPTFAAGVLGNSLPSAFIPVYLDVCRQRGEIEAKKFFSSVFFAFIVLLFLAMLLMWSLLPLLIPLIYTGFDDSTIFLTQKLLLIMIPFFLISTLSKFFAAVLNAEENFSLPGISPVFLPVTAVVSLMLFEPRFGIYSLALGIVAGSVFELTALGIGVRKKNIPIVPWWNGWTPEIKKMAVKYSPLIIGLLMLNSTLLIDQSMAAMLEEGSVSAYNYGNRIVAFFLGLVSVSFGAAIFPYFSKMISGSNWEGVLHTFKTYRKLIFLGGAVFSLGIFGFSEHLINLLYQRGEFTAEDTETVSLVLSFISLQMPFYMGQILLVRLIASLKANVILMWTSGLTLALNVLFNYVFMKIYGVAGIALSTSLVAGITYFTLYLALIRMAGRNFSFMGHAVARNLN